VFVVLRRRRPLVQVAVITAQSSRPALLPGAARTKPARAFKSFRSRRSSLRVTMHDRIVLALAVIGGLEVVAVLVVAGLIMLAAVL
jgi:hypothetical protein